MTRAPQLERSNVLVSVGSHHFVKLHWLRKNSAYSRGCKSHYDATVLRRSDACAERIFGADVSFANGRVPACVGALGQNRASSIIIPRRIC